jgi:aminoglycoside N3'-acetyltransferase
MLHVSMRAVGGDADALLDALLDVLGPSGTLVMLLCADDEDGPFDALTTPVDVEDMGVVAERFRLRAGDQVSDHPAARFAVIGAHAAGLLERNPLHHYYGPGSFLERLLELDVRVLRLGANVDTVTLTHHAEYLADVPDKIHVTRRYNRADTGIVDVHSLDDTDGIRPWAGGDYFGQILVDFVRSGHAAIGAVGRCTAELLEGPAFVDFAVRWMERALGSQSG